MEGWSIMSEGELHDCWYNAAIFIPTDKRETLKEQFTQNQLSLTLKLLILEPLVTMNSHCIA